MLIKVKVFPNSKKSGIIKKSEDGFEVKVREKPESGKANKAAIEILSSYFKLSEKNVKLIKGFKQKNKIFEIKTQVNVN